VPAIKDVYTHFLTSQPALIKLDNENIGGHLTPLQLGPQNCHLEPPPAYLDFDHLLAGCCKGPLNQVQFGFIRFCCRALHCSSLSSNRQCLSNEQCVNDKREDYQNCSVLQCTCVDTFGPCGSRALLLYPFPGRKV